MARIERQQDYFRFGLRITDEDSIEERASTLKLENDILIPSPMKVEVWKRDKGKRVICGRKDNQHVSELWALLGTTHYSELST